MYIFLVITHKYNGNPTSATPLQVTASSVATSPLWTLTLSCSPVEKPEEDGNKNNKLATSGQKSKFYKDDVDFASFPYFHFLGASTTMTSS